MRAIAVHDEIIISTRNPKQNCCKRLYRIIKRDFHHSVRKYVLSKRKKSSRDEKKISARNAYSLRDFEEDHHSYFFISLLFSRTVIKRNFYFIIKAQIK